MLASAAMAEPITPASLDVERLATAIFHASNQVRDELRLPRFRGDPRLDEAADLQASYTALHLAPGHFQILPELAQPIDRVRRVGLSPGAVAENAATLPLWYADAGSALLVESRGEENVYLDSRTGAVARHHTYASFASAVVKAWLESPGHRENLLNPSYEYLGCSGRPGRSANGFEVIAAVQVFFNPARGTKVERS